MAEVRVTNIPKRTWYATETDEKEILYAMKELRVQRSLKKPWLVTLPQRGNLRYSIYRMHVIALYKHVITKQLATMVMYNCSIATLSRSEEGSDVPRGSELDWTTSSFS